MSKFEQFQSSCKYQAISHYEPFLILIFSGKPFQTCVVCKVQGGLQKKTNNNKWLHVTCALHSEEWAVYDFKTMEIGPDFDKERPGKKSRAQRKKCDTCKSSDGVLQCNAAKCEMHTHLYCALKTKVQFLAKDEETKEGWTLYLETEKIDNIWASFDPSEDKLKWQVLALYKRCEKIVNGAEEPELTQEESMVEETKQEKSASKKKGGKKKASKKGDKKGNKKEVEMLEEKLEKEEKEAELEELVDPEAANEPIFVEIYQKLQARLLDLLSSREPSTNIKGGKMYLECPTHRSEDLLCICKKPNDPNIWMVRCDCCTNWFHGPCVGVKPEETQGDESWFCQQCKDWYRYKLSNLYHSNVRIKMKFTAVLIIKIRIRIK